jgi:hypothetical protein
MRLRPPRRWKHIGMRTTRVSEADLQGQRRRYRAFEATVAIAAAGPGPMVARLKAMLPVPVESYRSNSMQAPGTDPAR